LKPLTNISGFSLFNMGGVEMADPVELGAKRTKRKFLWLPKNLGGEYRWLKMATIEEELKEFR
jgi:hypothetical protein